MHPFLAHFLAFCAASAGAGLFLLLEFPAPSLTGSATGVTLVSLAGLRFDLPHWLRNGAFVVLGINIGNGVTPESLQAAADWPLSLAILGLSLPVGMAVTQAGMVHWLGFGRRDALLASTPGHLAYVLSLSLEKGGDTARIAVIQSIRVFFLSVGVPFLIAAIFGATGAQFAQAAPMTLATLALLVVGALALNLVYRRLKVPAPILMAGMTVSAIGHGTDLTPGQLSPGLGFAAFMVLGTLIGSRFSGQSVAILRSSALAGVWLTSVNVAVTLAAAAVGMAVLGVRPEVLIVAYAPGGVEAMAAIAVTLGLGPAYVAAHHVARILILTFLVPWWFRKIGDR